MFLQFLLKGHAEGFQLYDTLWANSAAFRIVHPVSKVSNSLLLSCFTLPHLTTPTPHLHPSAKACAFFPHCAEQAGSSTEPPGFLSLLLHLIFFYSTSLQIYHLVPFSSRKRWKSRGIIPRPWQDGGPQGGGWGWMLLRKNGSRCSRWGLKNVSHVNAAEEGKGSWG